MMDATATLVLTVARWMAVAFSLVGSRWVASTEKVERRSGFGIWLVGNCIWIGTSLILLDWPQVVLWAAYLYYAYRGWRNNE